MSDEIELKLRICDDGDRASDTGGYPIRISSRLNKLHVKHAISSPTIEDIETVYYDTHHYALRHAGLVFRIRNSASGSTATIKIDKGEFSAADSGPVFHRTEINAVLGALPNHAAAIHVFKGTEIWQILKKTTGRKRLYEKFRTVIRRTNYHLAINGGCSILISIDKGEIKSGIVVEPVNELEAELLSGTKAQLLMAGSMIAEAIPLIPEPKSKYERGLAAAGSPVAPQTRRTAKNPDVDMIRMTRVFAYYIQRMTDAQQVFLEGKGQIRSLHEIRVNLRHLQSLILFCRPFFKHSRQIVAHESDDSHKPRGLQDRGQYRKLTGIIKDTIGRLSPLRESDIFLRDLDEFAANRYSKEVTHDAKRNFETRRNLEQKKTHSALANGLLTPMTFALYGWMEACGDDLEAYVDKDFIAARINKLFDRMIDAMRPEALTGIAGYHKLRIKIKNARYIMEDYGATYYADGEEADQDAVSFFKKLQDCLGNMNDAYGNISHAMAYMPEGEFRSEFIPWLNNKIAQNNSVYESISTDLFRYIKA